MSRRILHVVTNIDRYPDHDIPTGLWLSELTHAHDVFQAQGFSQDIVSPQGGLSPLEPRALKWPMIDASAKAWLADESKCALLANTLRPDHVDADQYDALYFTGGHGAMWDFPDSRGLQEISRLIFERGGIVASVCHGYCGLLNVTLSDGSPLVSGRKLTGFSWREEVLAGVASKVPYNAEDLIKQRGALFEKAVLPFVPNVVVDGRLVTGQNPQSAKLTAKQVAAML